MTCSVCGKGPADGVTVYRNNPKGEQPDWRCRLHRTKRTPDEVQELVNILDPKERDHG